MENTGDMGDKAQRTGKGREEQVRPTPAPDRPDRARSKEESTRRRADEDPSAADEEQPGRGAGES
ncbi:hypothetical protein [Streptomyces sp. NPDC002990]